MALAGIKRALRDMQRFGRWLWRDVPKHPSLEFYARGQDQLNRAEFARIRAGEAEGRAVHLEPFHPAREIPKIIWIYWAQGEADAPHVVKRCLESWRRCNPDWDLRVLDQDSADALVDLSDVPEGLPRRFRANMLRLRLLKAHGGVWTDATTFCHRPFDAWLPLQAASSGFFVFGDPGPDRWFANWFIASEANGTLISAWEASYTRYLTRCDRQPEKYFMLTYAFQWCVRRDPALMAAWQRVARLPSSPTFLLMSALKGQVPMDDMQKVVSLGLPISKLSWKSDIPPADIDRALDQFSHERAQAQVGRVGVRPMGAGCRGPSRPAIAPARLPHG